MAFQYSDFGVSPQDFYDVSEVQNAPLGTIRRGKDATLGEGEFVYLKGVVGTVFGDTVIYDQRAGTTTRTVAGSRGPVAVALAPVVADRYGWYQVNGSAVVRTAAGAVANASVYVTATAGQVDDAVVATDKIDGARYKSASDIPAAGYAVLQIDRPSLNGNG